MPYPIHTVSRFDRRTRRVLETVASGLTMDAASNLARALREQSDDETAGYEIGTMPLEEQVEHLAAGETVAALRAAA